MIEEKLKIQRIKQALLGFVLTFIGMLALLTAQFLLSYSEEIFGKHFDNSIIINITFLGLLSMVTLSLPISILVMSTIYYRQLIRQGQRISIKTGLIISILVSIVCFIWVAFLAPVNDKHMMGLLYDIGQTAPNEQLKRTDINFFNGTTLTSNYFELGKSIDSCKSKINKADRQEIQLKEHYYREIIQAKIKRANMIELPFLTFILFYFGMFVGILNRQNKLVFLLLSIYIMILPGIYYLSRYFDKLERRLTLTPFQGRFLYLLILTILTFGLLLYAKRQIQKENYCW